MGHYQACEQRSGLCWTSRCPMRAGLYGLLCCDQCSALPFSAQVPSLPTSKAAPEQRPSQVVMQFHEAAGAAHDLGALRTLAEEVQA